MGTCGSRKFFCGHPEDFRDGCEQGGRDLRAVGQLPPEDVLRGDIPTPDSQQVSELAGTEAPFHARPFQAQPAQPPAGIGDEPQGERQRVSLQRRGRVLLGDLPCCI